MWWLGLSALAASNGQLVLRADMKLSRLMCSFKTMAGYLKSAHAVAEEEMCTTSEVEASGPAMTCHAVVGAEIASSGELRLRAH